VSNGILGTDDGQYRIYKNQTLTISVPEGHHITAVQFECTAEGTSKYGPGCFSEMDGYSYQGAYGSWEGYISSLTFTAEHNQVRATKIEVTVE